MSEELTHYVLLVMSYDSEFSKVCQKLAQRIRYVIIYPVSLSICQYYRDSLAIITR